MMCEYVVRSGRTALMGAAFGGHTASLRLLVTNEIYYTRFSTEPSIIPRPCSISLSPATNV